MKFIPEVIDLVDALVDIAASLTSQPGKSELCKTHQSPEALKPPTSKPTFKVPPPALVRRALPKKGRPS